MGEGILATIKVIDMTEGVAGPYAAMLLADMGANVIKVERPEGDWSRTAGAARLAEVGGAQFVSLNRNKRNIGLDLGIAGASTIIERLVTQSDVILSNYRAGVMSKLGVGYKACQVLNPSIIYCTVSGFGQAGPYAQLPASDTIMQAMSGVMSLVGESNGPPLRVGFPLIDLTAANHSVQAILLALYGRLTGHGGAEIDISLMAAGVALMGAQLTDHLASGRMPARQGNQNISLAPAGAYQVQDGRYITIAVLRDSHWRKFCAAVKLDRLAEDDRFSTNAARVNNRVELDQIIVPLLGANTSKYWLERLRSADILCGPINTLADVVADPALVSGLPLIDPRLPGVPRVMGTPIRYNGEYYRARRSPPAKGEHTREVLEEFAFASAEIDVFLRSGAAFTTAP